MHMGVALIIALALSVDGFGVGMAYGLKRIKIPLTSMLIIAFCTALAMGISMMFGQWIIPRITFVSPRFWRRCVNCYRLLPINSGHKKIEDGRSRSGNDHDCSGNRFL